MAKVSFVMSDTEDGSVKVDFVSDGPLPEHIQDYTPAQVFAMELRKSLLENGNIVE